MDSKILTGSTVESILKKFCQENNINKNDVNYEVIEEGKSGFLGFIGGKKASIKIVSFGDKQKVLAFIKGLLEKMGVDYVDIDVNEKNDSVTYHIVGSDDAGFLIGKEARFLNNMQYLVNRIFETRENRKRIYIDVDDYKKRQAETITKKYMPIFDKVVANQKPYTLEPLDPNIRRILHQYIDENDSLSTLTIGDGKRKRIVVFPKGYDQSKIRKRSYIPPKKRRDPNSPETSPVKDAAPKKNISNNNAPKKRVANNNENRPKPNNEAKKKTFNRRPRRNTSNQVKKES